MTQMRLIDCWRRLGAAAVAAMLVSACLVQETTETWYVEASGRVTWVVHQQDIRSDARAAEDRAREEAEYWLSVQQERHPVLAGLRELGGQNLRTTILRTDSPYSVRTEARFAGLDTLGQRLITAIGSTGSSTITRDAGVWEWRFEVRDPSALGTSNEPSTDVSALVNDIDRLRVVLVSGHFESAEGFELSSDRRVATIKVPEPDSGGTASPIVTLRLSWR
jgi:hypothetical protein